jgi:hypothetical protein
MVSFLPSLLMLRKEDLGVDGKIYEYNLWNRAAVYEPHISGFGHGPVAVSCECGNEPSSS